MDVDSHTCNSRQSSPRYKLVSSIQQNEHDNTIAEEVTVLLDWGGQSKTPVKSYPNELLKLVASRLFIGSPNLGGKLVENSVIEGFTDVTINGNLFRCHPFYANVGSWYDWAYFNWEGYDECIPARLLMILDLSNTEIVYDVDIDKDKISECNNHMTTTPHLTNEKWVVVEAAQGPSMQTSDISTHHISSSIITRIRFEEEEKIWIVPLTALVKPCYVVANINYCEMNGNGESTIGDNTAYIVKPMDKWANVFLPKE